MITPEMVKRFNLHLPLPGFVIVQTLKKNISKKCLVVRVGKVNATIEINGIEAKVSNDLVDIADEFMYPDEAGAP